MTAMSHQVCCPSPKRARCQAPATLADQAERGINRSMQLRRIRSSGILVWLTAISIVVVISTASIQLLADVPVPGWWEPILKLLPDYLVPPLSTSDVSLVMLTLLAVIALLIGAVRLIRRILTGIYKGAESQYLRRLTPDEAEQLTPKDRQDALNAARAIRLQTISTWGVILGVAFTAGSLIYTSGTLETAQEGLITDRYTKAVEQLSSPSADVRLGAIYALQRIADDSERDRSTIRRVLAAFVRNHDFCTLQHGQKRLPKRCDVTSFEDYDDIPIIRLPTDTSAALSIAPALQIEEGEVVDLSQVRFPRADFRGMNLSGLNLSRSDLSGADLSDTELFFVDLSHADLRGANLANASVPSLMEGNVDEYRHLVADLRGADLRRADLRGADLRLADLSNVDLRGARMEDALLHHADLRDADLRGVDLRKAKGLTLYQRREAIIDPTTRF